MNYDQPELNLNDDSSDSKPEQKPQTEEETSTQEIPERDETDTCTMCKNGGFCPKHQDRSPRKLFPQTEPEEFLVPIGEPVPLTQEDIESSNRVADHEAEIQEVEEDEVRQLSPEEAVEYLKKLREDENQS